jgi:glycosyltransferase involved in cell wall biosynthesis
MRVLHAIHDFLPRHRAGSEIYALELAKAQSVRHDVFVLAAEYDPSAAHGTLRWRSVEGLTVIELVNNWEFKRFEETYSSPRINAQLRHVLDATRPDVLHVHNLLNLSFDLPRLAKERGIATAATLHDHTLVCASGGQRVHVAESYVCDTIDPARCSRCFTQSPFYAQMAAGRATRLPGGRALAGAARLVRRLAPSAAAAAARALDAGPVHAGDVRRRLAYARHTFDTIDLFVAPSSSIAEEFARLGVDPRRMHVSDYGFVPFARTDPSRQEHGRLRIGFVGTLVWHKGAHLLLDAARLLNGDVEVHLHGDTTVFPDYVSRLRRAAAGLRVTFHGGFERGRTSEVYRNLDVLVVPSLWPENSPLVIHEAFMQGVPVVAARIGGIAGLVGHDVNGLLYDPFSAESLRDALQRLLEEPRLRARLSAAAPAVKTIEADAREWDARYAGLRQERGKPAAAAIS